MRAAIFMVLLTALIGAAPAAADTTPPQIHTLAGGGSCSGPETTGGPCDNVAATSVPINHPRSVATLGGGAYLFVDEADDLVREVSSSGVVVTVAGNGTTQDAPDGTAAVSSGLNDPVAVAPLPNGGFLITEYAGSVVRMVDTSGTITTVAGTGVAGNNGTSGQATSIQLNHPTDAEPTADGSILIADTYNNVIREVSPSGQVFTIAGGGPCDDSVAGLPCDGMAADAVTLHHPDSVSPIQGGAGGYLIAEYDESAVRKVAAVDPTGVFTTVAGVPGQAGYGGDGGPASQALLNHPEQVLSTSDGGFLIADTLNSRIRAVSASGTITTVAGDGVDSYSGDGGAATAAALQHPASVTPRPGGGYWIADTDNNVIRGVTLAPTTKITLSPAAPQGKNGWYIATVQATVTATGGKTTNCELDPPQAPPVFDAIPPGCPYSASGAYITGDGTHTIYAASVNSYGDKEIPVSVTFKIDTTAPTLDCGTAPSFKAGTPGATVIASVIDDVSGPVTAEVSAPVDTSQVGKHTVLLSGADQAGNVGQAQCPYTVTASHLVPVPQLQSRFPASRGKSTVASLILQDVTPRETVDVSCRGKGCPFKQANNVTGQLCGKKPCQDTGAKRRRKRGAVDLAPLFARLRLGSGARLTVTVTEPGAIGRIWVVTLHRKGKPTHTDDCLEPGSTSKLTSC